MTGMLFLKSGAWSMAHEMTKAAPEINIYFYSFEFESDDSLFPWIFMNSPDNPIEGGKSSMLFYILIFSAFSRSNWIIHPIKSLEN